MTDSLSVRPFLAPRVALRAFLLGGVLATSPSLSAQSLDDRETAGPAIALGETELFPSLRLDALRTDNVYRTAADEISASSVVVAPRLLWVADRRLLTLRGTYDGEYARSDEDVLEHADHRLGLAVSTTPGKRWRADGTVSVARDHQIAGTSLTRNADSDFDEPVTFDELRFAASGGYGASRARGNLTFGLGVIDRDYTNLESFTDGFAFREIEPFGRFSLRLSGDTRALLELRYSDVDFDADERDRQDASVFGGVSFLVTGRSSGELKAGVTRSNYAREGRANENTFVVEGRLEYAAREYSRLEFTLTRELDNVAGARIDEVGGEAVRDFAGVEWTYDWSERVSQTAFASFERITRDCPQFGEDNASLGLELALQVRRWLDLGVSARADRRTGKDCEEVDEVPVDSIDYDASVIGLFVRARL